MKTIKYIIDLFKDLEKKMADDTNLKLSVIKNNNKFIA